MTSESYLARDADVADGAADRREREIRRRVRRQAEFYRHLIVYVAVCGLLWAINLTHYARIERAVPWFGYWALYPTLGWGIGVMMHGLATTERLLPFSAGWEERKVRELLAREAEDASRPTSKSAS